MSTTLEALAIIALSLALLDGILWTTFKIAFRGEEQPRERRNRMKLRHRGRVHNDPLYRQIRAEFGPGTEGGRKLRGQLSNLIGEDLLADLERQAKPRRVRKAGPR